MIKYLQLAGFKAFREQVRIELAPIAVFTGGNSSGKSSAIQSVLLIKQGMEAAPRDFAGIALNGPYVALGAWEDAASNYTPSPSDMNSLLDAIDEDTTRSVPSMTLGFGLQATVDPREQGPSLRSAGGHWVSNSWRALSAGNVVLDVALSLSFEQCDAQAKAHLSKIELTSHKTSRDGDSSSRITYSLSVQPLKTTLEEIGLGSDFPADDEYPFLATISISGVDPRKPASEDDMSASVDRGRTIPCGVEGVLPTTYFQATTHLAFPYSLSIVAWIAIQEFLRTCNGAEGTVPYFGRWKPANHVVDSDSHNKKLANAAQFFRDAPFDALVANAQSDPTVLGNAVIGYILEASQKRRELWAEILTAYTTRLLEKRRTETRQEFSVETETELQDFFAENKSLAPVIELFRRSDGEYNNLGVDCLQRCLIQYKTKAKRGDPVLAGDWKPFFVRRHSEHFVNEADVRKFFVDYVYYLGPLRDEPRSVFASEVPASPTDVGKRGERAIACLGRFADLPVSVEPPVGIPRAYNHRLLAQTIAWGKYLGIFHSLSIDGESKYGTVCKVSIDAWSQSSLLSDLTNVGVGVSQLLPMIVLCLAAPKYSTVMIEQPELHLHPSVQTRLATFFVACRRAGLQLVIETHSEHLVNGLRLEVVRKQVDPSELALTFFGKDEFGPDLTSIPIASDGSMSAWPSGFFDEAEKTLSAIISTRVSAPTGDV